MLFWLPLAGMWLIMGIEQPTIAAVVSRLPNATISLAAFEVAFGLATLIHSPIVQLLSAATSFSVDRQTFRRLFRLSSVIILIMTTLHAVLAIPAVFNLVALRILRIPDLVVPHAHRAFVILLPITAAVGYRRFLQGALIRVGRTGLVSAIMVGRLAVTTLFLGLILLTTGRGLIRPPGEIVAALAFSLGTIAGAVGAFALIRRVILPALPDQVEVDASGKAPLTTRRMLVVYMPLAMTSIIIMIGRPLVAFAIGRSVDPVPSLAAWPVVQGFLFVFTAIAHSFQEVVVARHATHPAERGVLRKLGLGIGTGLAAVILVMVVTQLDTGWFSWVMDAPRVVVPFILDAVAILWPLPLAVASISITAGTLVSEHKTTWISAATVVAIAVQITLGVVLPATTTLHGARVAAIILLSSALVQVGVQWMGFSRLRGSLPHASQTTTTQ